MHTLECVFKCFSLDLVMQFCIIMRIVDAQRLYDIRFLSYTPLFI